MPGRRLPRLPGLLVLAILLAVPASAAAQTYTVDSLGDSAGGACSAAPADCTLRDALSLAEEAAGGDEIEFAVTGTIEPSTPLPVITKPTTIDGTSAPGYAGAPLVALKAAGSADEHEGLALIAGSGGSSISGLAIGGFEVGAYLADTGAGSSLCGNYLGLGLDGETAIPNSTGAQVGVESPNNLIGAGCGALGGNLIAGNSGYGVVDFGADTQISANGIGVDAAGAPLGNGPPGGAAAGVLITQFAEGPFVGGVPDPGPGESAPNTIANNEGPGIKVESSASNASIRRNSIYANSGGGIEFADSSGPGALEVNNFVPFPGETLVTVFLSGLAASQEYAVDVFVSSRCDAQNYGPGEVFLGSGTGTTDPSGNGQASVNGIPLAGLDAESFTATATNLATGATTQFSLCGRTPPETQLDSHPPALSSSSTPSFTFSGTDFGHIDHFLCSLDAGPFVTCATPHQLSAVADGSHEFAVRAVDGEGWSDLSSATYEWTVDATPPQSSIQSGPGAETASTDATFQFSASDATSGVEAVECSLDGGPFQACSSPRSYSGLAAGAHSFAVRASDKAGNVEANPASYSWKAGVSAAPLPVETKPAPENGESVAVAPAGGKVFVARPGQKGRAELVEGETIPVGSVVDATRGKVTLTSVNRAGETQTAVFYGGKFLIAEQERNGLVVLKLRGVLRCGKARPSAATASAGRKGRRLWGSGKGKFRTEGNYASATVRGTIWLTEDRCGGTFVKVRRGVVSVRDFRAGQTTSVPAGKSYFAKAGP